MRQSTIVMREHTRGKRIWLQGAYLIAYGFAPNTRIRVTFGPAMCVINADPAGERKVSDTAKGPVIDLIGAGVTEAFRDYERAIVTVSPGAIIIVGSPKGY